MFTRGIPLDFIASPKMMVKGVHWGKSQQSLLEFPNSLILPNVHMGHFPDNSSEDLPWLPAGGWEWRGSQSRAVL